MKNELQLLIESLEKKKVVLNSILVKSKEQEKTAVAESFDVEKFDRLVDEKADLLLQMDKLDQGFDAVYTPIKKELVDGKDLYKTEIGHMQKLIRETVDLGAEIHVTEARTKERMSKALQNSRRELRKQKVSTKSVRDYYKANSQLSHTNSYFIDKKK